jgi:anti-sigma factor RsiW
VTGDHVQLDDYLYGQPSDGDAARVEAHLAVCDHCAEDLDRLVRTSELLADAAAALGARHGHEPLGAAGRARGRRLRSELRGDRAAAEASRPDAPSTRTLHAPRRRTHRRPPHAPNRRTR